MFFAKCFVECENVKISDGSRPFIMCYFYLNTNTALNNVM